MGNLILRVGNRMAINARDLAHASALYGAARDESQEGGSTFPEGSLMQSGRKIARISYNGRVWDSAVQFDGRTPSAGLLYCPNSAGKDEGQPRAYAEGREAIFGRSIPNRYPEGSAERRAFESGAASAKSASAKPEGVA